MIFSALNRLAKSNPTLARGGGYLLGYLAASPLRHPFAALAALSIGGEYLKRKREAAAMTAARLAAITTAKMDPACRDPRSAECLDHARANAVRAGMSAMGNAPADDRDVPHLLWRFAFRFVLLLVVLFVALYIGGILTR